MRFWHPAGYWRLEKDSDSLAPLPAELAAVFDELEQFGELSTDSWVSLRRLGYSMEGEPFKAAHLIRDPADEEFNPDLILDGLTSGRYDELHDGASPTEEEISRWKERFMAQAGEGGEGGYLVMIWAVSDDRQRTQFLVTLHLDHASFHAVAGIYPTIEQVDAALRSEGEVEWIF